MGFGPSMYNNENGDPGHGSFGVEPGQSLFTRESLFASEYVEATRSWNIHLSRSSIFGGNTERAGHHLSGPPPRLFTTGSLFNGPLPPLKSSENLLDRPYLPMASHGSLFSSRLPSLWEPGGVFSSNNSTSTRTGDFLGNASTSTSTIGAGGIFGSGGLGNVNADTSRELPQLTSILPRLLPPLVPSRRFRLLNQPTASIHQQSSDPSPESANRCDILAIDVVNTINSPPSDALFSAIDRRHTPRRKTRQQKKSYEEVERERKNNLSVPPCTMLKLNLG